MWWRFDRLGFVFKGVRNLKLLNLIPKENIKKNRNQLIRKILISLTIVPVAFYGYMQYSLYSLSGEIEELEQNVSEAVRLEASIKGNEEKTARINNIVTGVDRQTLPLNHFMLFMGESTPSTVKIHSVVSEELVNERLAEGLTSEGYDLSVATSGRVNYVEEESNVEEGVDGDNVPKTGTDNGNVAVGDAKKSENGTSPKNSNNQSKNGSVPSDKVEQKDNIVISVNTPKVLLIRGYTTSVNDLGYFTSKLKGEKYVEDVEINTIKNYYNGVDNYRIFEIRLKVGVGGE